MASKLRTKITTLLTTAPNAHPRQQSSPPDESSSSIAPTDPVTTNATGQPGKKLYIPSLKQRVTKGKTIEIKDEETDPELEAFRLAIRAKVAEAAERCRDQCDEFFGRLHKEGIEMHKEAVEQVRLEQEEKRLEQQQKQHRLYEEEELSKVKNDMNSLSLSQPGSPTDPAFQDSPIPWFLTTTPKNTPLSVTSDTDHQTISTVVTHPALRDSYGATNPFPDLFNKFGTTRDPVDQIAYSNVRKILHKWWIDAQIERQNDLEQYDRCHGKPEPASPVNTTSSIPPVTPVEVAERVLAIVITMHEPFVGDIDVKADLKAEMQLWDAKEKRDKALLNNYIIDCNKRGIQLQVDETNIKDEDENNNIEGKEEDKVKDKEKRSTKDEIRRAVDAASKATDATRLSRARCEIAWATRYVEWAEEYEKKQDLQTEEQNRQEAWYDELDRMHNNEEERREKAGEGKDEDKGLNKKKNRKLYNPQESSPSTPNTSVVSPELAGNDFPNSDIANDTDGSQKVTNDDGNLKKQGV